MIIVKGSAADQRGISAVAVRVGPNQPVYAASTDGFRTWTVELPVPQYDFEVSAVSYSLSGLSSPVASVLVTRVNAPDDSGSPSLVILSPEDGSTPDQLLALVEGTTSDDRGVVSMTVERNTELLTEREVSTSDFFAHWSRLVPLLAGEANLLTFTAKDSNGHETTSQITLYGKATTDRTPPTLIVRTPTEGATVNTENVPIEGSAQATTGVRDVRVRLGYTASGSDTPVYTEYQNANTADGYANFQASLPARRGPLTLEVVATNLNGITTRVLYPFDHEFDSDWSDETELPLFLRKDTRGQLFALSLSKDGINDIFSADLQRDTAVLELDTSTLTTDALNKIKSSCGSAWQLDSQDPHHDCANAGYSSPWQESPEYSLVRLLTFTLANVVVAGTSLAKLEGVADGLNIGGGFRTVLAQALGIPSTQEIVPTAAVAKALREYWMQAHPNVLPGAKLPVSLYDAMQDMATLGEKLGPLGDHPGVIDPSFTPRAQVLTDDFHMKLVATSNLRWFDGIITTADNGEPLKDYLALVDDQIGPTYDDMLEFDFEDPSRFEVVGIAAHPRVDLRLALKENPSFVHACTAGDSCKANTLNSPQSPYVWSLPKWQLETVVGAAAYFQYQNRAGAELVYPLCVSNILDAATNGMAGQTLTSATVDVLPLEAATGLLGGLGKLIDTVTGPLATAAAPVVQTVQNATGGVTSQLLCYPNAARITVGYNNPAGWVTYETLAGVPLLQNKLGEPPPPQYAWETILEIAEVALHNYSGMTRPEGAINVAFTLKDVDVGLTADQIRDAMRPMLQKQRSELSARLFSDRRQNNGAVDFYYRRGADGVGYIYFVDPSDPLPTDSYAYSQPGFFADTGLTQKLSSKADGGSGDSVHEKLALQQGTTTVYISDAKQQMVRLRFSVGQDPSEVRVRIAHKVR